MNDTLTIILGVVSFTAVVLCPFIINKITKYKLEMEKMRLEADVRKEEIRCRNQLELDKFINAGQSNETAAVRINADTNGAISNISGNPQYETGGTFEGTRSGVQADVGTITGNNGRERLKY